MTRNEFIGRLGVFSLSSHFRGAGKRLLYTDTPMSTPLAGGRGCVWCSTTPYGWYANRAGEFMAYDLEEDLMAVVHNVDGPSLFAELVVFFALVDGVYEEVPENHPRVTGFVDAFRAVQALRAA